MDSVNHTEIFRWHVSEEYYYLQLLTHYFLSILFIWSSAELSCVSFFSTSLGQGNVLQNIHYFGHLPCSPQRPVVLKDLLHCLYIKVLSKLQQGAAWHCAGSKGMFRQ